MKAVIMAGGKGTRLRQIANDIPKPMISIMGRPILEYQIESLKKSGIHEIVLIIGHLGEAVRKYFALGGRHGVRIDYLVEEEPLGTAGALYHLKDKLREDFFLIFGDLILDVDFNRFMDFHRAHNASITVFSHPNAHPFDSDLIVADQDGKVTGIEAKNSKREFWYHNLVNAGIYCVSPRALARLERPGKADMEKNLVARLAGEGTVYAYRSTEYVRDMGTPERLLAVSEDIRNGVVESRSLKNRQRAVFLDRDGTINALDGFIKSAAQFRLLPDAAEALQRINSSQYLAVVITNQPVIARGECTFEELEEIHKKMETELGSRGAYIDDLFFCPHHPHKGYEGEVAELKFECGCRKPKTGLLVRAAEKYNIDLSRSWFVGDTGTDIQTGLNAGMRTALVRTGGAGAEGTGAKPDYTADSLTEAVAYILGRKNERDE